MEGVQTVDVSWLHHSQKGKFHVLCSALLQFRLDGALRDGGV